MTSHQPEPKITIKEIKKATKHLKRKKSPGPDNIPNEIFIEANKETQNIYKNILNNILNDNKSPQQWQKGNIIRRYKGKGKKGKCSNERGIMLASNFGKLYERIINNRAEQKVNMSDAQAGGRRGSRATVDHIMIIKEAIQAQKTNKKPIYITFLDITKAYDGPTRDIKIKDSIRQGGVLSVLQYIMLLDEINKEITRKM